MKLSDPELWIRIQAFQLGNESIALPFRKRLARENNWSEAFAERAIDEYKRFVYLCCISDVPLTPSDEVDQVWHLHLAYTRNYWDVFCKGVLHRPLHHGPTQGGSEEASKFTEWYELTKTTYKQEFGEDPPIDLWPETSVRFSRPANMKRVDTSSKHSPKLSDREAYTGLGLLGVIGVYSLFKQHFVFGMVILFCAFILLIYRLSKNNGNNGDGGCGGVGGCGGGGDSSSDSTSGDSGCGASGCGGCGGGD